MNEEINISKEKLSNLLKAAHSAYQSQPKPPAAKADDWVDWYVDYVVDKLGKPAVAESSEEATTSKMPDPQLPVTNKLSEKTATDAEKAKAELVTVRTPPDPSAGDPKAAEQAAGGVEVPRKTEPDLGALQVCPTCAHRNRPGVLLCENCGTNLLTGQQTGVGTRDLRSEPEEKDEGADKSSEVKQTLRLNEMQHEAVKTAGTSVFARDMFLRIEIDGGPEPIIIRPKSEDMILGRRDPTTGATPEVDLTAFAGYRMGVSRRHASLALENNQLNLWDLGSSNGTFVNGTRLTPHQPNLIRDGDEVRLGQMVIRLFFQNND
jgi:hypothetical protein